MKYILRLCSGLTIVNGVGHLMLASFYERQTSFWLMISFGCLYTLLGTLVWVKGRKPLLITGGIMCVAGPIAAMSIRSLGYPVNLLALFIGLDFLVIALTGIVIWWTIEKKPIKHKYPD